MPNPNSHVATIRIARVAGGTEVYMKSAILEKKIKADASVGPEMKRALLTPPSWWPGNEVYRVELPDFNGSYNITSEPGEGSGIENIVHLIRCVGLEKGVKMLMPRPMSVSMTQRLAKNIRNYLKFIYEEYYTEISVEYTLTQREPDRIADPNEVTL